MERLKRIYSITKDILPYCNEVKEMRVCPMRKRLVAKLYLEKGLILGGTFIKKEDLGDTEIWTKRELHIAPDGRLVVYDGVSKSVYDVTTGKKEMISLNRIKLAEYLIGNIDAIECFTEDDVLKLFKDVLKDYTKGLVVEICDAKEKMNALIENQTIVNEAISLIE